jgi:hypothetical protein
MTGTPDRRAQTISARNQARYFQTVRETQTVRPWTIAAVLPPIDDTGLTVQYAIDVAEEASARLVLLQLKDAHPNIRHSEPGGPGGAAANLNSRPNIEQVVLSGPPAISIPRYADSIDADFILVVEQHLRRQNRRAKPFVPDALVSSTSRPVWLTRVASEPGAVFRCRRIVCSINLHPSDQPVISHAASLASRTKAELVLVHVLPPVADGMLWWRVALDRPTRASVAGERIRELAERVGAVSSSIVTTGAVHKSIARLAEDVGADIVVMPHSVGPTLKAPLPAAALRHFSCAVALVPVTSAYAPTVAREDQLLGSGSLA